MSTQREANDSLGEIAKVILDVERKEDIFRPVPNCQHKEKLMTALEKFHPIYLIYKKREPTEEDIQKYPVLTGKLYDYWKTNLDWIPFTDVLHLIAAHNTEYLNDPDGTHSIHDMSSSGIELSNKQMRASFNRRTWKGNVEVQLDQAHKHSYLSSAFEYRSTIEERKREYTCSNCLEIGHKKDKCPNPQIHRNVDDLIQLVQQDLEITTTEAETETTKESE